MAQPKLSTVNSELMDAVLKVVIEAKADAVLAAGILLDAAAAVMATQPRLRNPAADLRATCEEARKRLKGAIRAHQELLDAHATNAPVPGAFRAQGP